MDTFVKIIAGFFFLGWFFHSVQWYNQLKFKGIKPVWFKIAKRSQ